MKNQALFSSKDKRKKFKYFVVCCNFVWRFKLKFFLVSLLEQFVDNEIF